MERNPWHNLTLEDIKRLFKDNGFNPRKTTSLPTKSNRNTYLYQPDAIFEKYNKIQWILEVDSNYQLKHVMGGIYLANLCLNMEEITHQPTFMYVLREIKPHRKEKLDYAIKKSKKLNLLDCIGDIEIRSREEALEFFR